MRWSDMAELDLLTEESRFRALMENTEDSIYFKDRDCRLLGVSQRMAVNLGFSDPSELVGKTDVDLFGESFGRGKLMEDRKIMESGVPVIGIIESRMLEGAALNWTSTTKVPIRDGSGVVIGLMGITREINELKRAELDLQHLATHDRLTDLPNRYLLMDRMAQTIAHAARASSIDDFKATNDEHGHEFGDVVLQSIAQTLQGTVRSSDTVARIGGDEFVIVLETLGGRLDARSVADKVLASVAKPVTLQGHTVKTTVSIGISFYPDNSGDAEALVRAADYAMYLAKAEGKNSWQVCPKGLPGPGKHFRPTQGTVSASVGAGS